MMRVEMLEEGEIGEYDNGEQSGGEEPAGGTMDAVHPVLEENPCSVNASFVELRFAVQQPGSPGVEGHVQWEAGTVQDQGASLFKTEASYTYGIESGNMADADAVCRKSTDGEGYADTRGQIRMADRDVGHHCRLSANPAQGDPRCSGGGGKSSEDFEETGLGGTANFVGHHSRSLRIAPKPQTMGRLQGHDGEGHDV